jgi:hypothetical protein
LLGRVELGKIEAAQMPDGDVMVREDEISKENGDLPWLRVKSYDKYCSLQNCR